MSDFDQNSANQHQLWNEHKYYGINKNTVEYRVPEYIVWNTLFKSGTYDCQILDPMATNDPNSGMNLTTLEYSILE